LCGAADAGVLVGVGIAAEGGDKEIGGLDDPGELVALAFVDG